MLSAQKPARGPWRFLHWCRRRGRVHPHPFSSTMRTSGRPSASTVARAIALGSFGSLSRASANHCSNRAKRLGRLRKVAGSQFIQGDDFLPLELKSARVWSPGAQVHVANVNRPCAASPFCRTYEQTLIRVFEKRPPSASRPPVRSPVSWQACVGGSRPAIIAASPCNDRRDQTRCKICKRRIRANIAQALRYSAPESRPK